MALTGTVELSTLTPAERLDLIGQLWDSLDEQHVQLTTDQKLEIDRRLETLDSDCANGIPWSELKAELEGRAA